MGGEREGGVFMRVWPFAEKHAPISEPELIAAFKARLDALNDRHDKFERIVKDMRLEWDEMYDKFRLLFARLSKRIRDAAELEAVPDDAKTPAQEAPSQTIGVARVVGGPRIPRRNY